MMSRCELYTSERQGEREKFALHDGEMGKAEAQNERRLAGCSVMWNGNI